MLIMTAKVDKKKLIIAVVAVIAAIAVLLAFCSKPDEPAQQTAASAAATQEKVESNDDRVKFLTDFGWDVTASPAESMQVRIPSESSEVFDRYNALQKSQGYDLSQFAGKTVMRYVYQINNFPGATEPVYATLLVHKNKVIGGDVTNSAPGGQVQGFAMPQSGS